MNTTKTNGYTLDDYSPYIKGDVVLPNWEELHTEEVTDNIASIGHSLTPVWGHFLRPDGHRAWAFYFLSPSVASLQAGSDRLSGEGYVLIYGGYSGKTPRAGRFALCKHEKEEGPGANHSRGYHPGRCRLCGMNMTVDSSD